MSDSLNAFVLSALVLLGGGTLCLLLGRALRLHPALAAALFAWHSILAFFYSSYILQNGGDAFVYYQRARFDFVELSFGTDFIVWLSSIPVSIGFSFWPLASLYNIVGAAGLLFFCAALRETPAFSTNATYGRLVALLCCVMPSLSFWTSGIGKDAPAFLSVALFLWSTMKLHRRQVVAVAAVLIMLPVRPHIAMLMVLSTAAGTVFVEELRASVRFGIAASGAAAAVFAVPLALAYSGSTRFDSLGAYISERQEQNLGGGSSIDIAGMNPLGRLFSYTYRPLPNEASGLDQLSASIDNLILLGLTVAGIILVYRAGIGKVFRRHSIHLIYGFATLVMLSQVTANLGLAARQKWMSLPALMLVLVGAWGIAAANSSRNRPRVNPLLARPRAQP